MVLPTESKTSLPFACNAPFVQDPSREKIKDPEKSPTNRWLLERTGKLAAQTMLCWLRRDDLTRTERAAAYGLLPEPQSSDDFIEVACTNIIANAFHETIKGERFLLTESNQLVAPGECVSVPLWLTEVWDHEQVAALFDANHRPLVARELGATVRKALVRKGYLAERTNQQVLEVLKLKEPRENELRIVFRSTVAGSMERPHASSTYSDAAPENSDLPRPDSWRKLLTLWVAVEPSVTANTPSWQTSWKTVRIVPVQGQNRLYAANEVVRLGDKRMLRSDEDREFLSHHILVMNPNWGRYLAEQRCAAESAKDARLAKDVAAAEKVLQAIGLRA